MNKFLIVLLCVFLCGCATGMKTEVGSPIINQENIAKIEKGKTTQEEILVLFGEPIAKTESGAFGKMWTYSRSVSTLTDQGFFKGIKQDAQSIGLTIIFDEINIVKDYSYTQINPMQDVKISNF